MAYLYSHAHSDGTGQVICDACQAEIEDITAKEYEHKYKHELMDLCIPCKSSQGAEIVRRLERIYV